MSVYFVPEILRAGASDFVQPEGCRWRKQSIFRSSALPVNSVISHGAGRGSSGSRGMYLLVVCHPAAKIFLGVVSFL